jgi:hypothetical protein
MVIVPLNPGGEIHNRRSWGGLDNLVDLILICADHSKAVNQTLLISASEDLSTTEQLRNIGNVLGETAHKLWVPAGGVSF